MADSNVGEGGGDSRNFASLPVLDPGARGFSHTDEERYWQTEPPLKTWRVIALACATPFTV